MVHSVFLSCPPSLHKHGTAFEQGQFSLSSLITHFFKLRNRTKIFGFCSPVGSRRWRLKKKVSKANGHELRSYPRFCFCFGTSCRWCTHRAWFWLFSQLASSCWWRWRGHVVRGKWTWHEKVAGGTPTGNTVNTIGLTTTSQIQLLKRWSLMSSWCTVTGLSLGGGKQWPGIVPCWILPAWFIWIDFCSSTPT